jgi:dihydroxyacetone kinase-like protein
MDASTFRAWIREAARLVVDNADHLTHLDAAIGDADHGINLRRGFQAAVVMLDETDPATPAAVLATVGRALISKTGGASGPLYGTGFRQAAKTLGEDPDVTAVQLGAALRAALDGIQQLGAANEGDKTMVDALAPAVGAYQTIVDTGGDLAEATRAAADVRRYEHLLQYGAVSRQERDNAVATNDKAAADLDAARKAQQAAADALRQQEAQLAQERARLESAQAAPDQIAQTRAQADQLAAQIR